MLNKKRVLLQWSLWLLSVVWLWTNVSFAATNDCFVFDANTQTITSYSSSYACSKDIVIPAQINNVDVLKIWSSAFERNGIKSLSFESWSKLQVIGPSAFNWNSTLKGDLVTPSSLKVIDIWAFWNTSFSNITLNEGLETIWQYAFGVNRVLWVNRNKLIIPTTVKALWDWAIWGYWNEVVIPQSVTDATWIVNINNQIYHLNPTDKTAWRHSILNYVSWQDIIVDSTVTYQWQTYKVSSPFSSSWSSSFYSPRTEGNELLKNTDPDINIPLKLTPQAEIDYKMFIEDGLLLQEYIDTNDNNKTKLEIIMFLDRAKTDLTVKSSYRGITVGKVSNLGITNSFLQNITFSDGFETLDVNSLHGNQLKTVNLPSTAKDAVLVAYRENMIDQINIAGYTWTDGYVLTSWYGWSSPTRANKKQYLSKGVIYEEMDNGELIASYVANINNYELQSVVNGKKVTVLDGGVTSPKQPSTFVIPEGVTKMVGDTLILRSNVTKLVIPSTLTSISTSDTLGGTLVGWSLRSFNIPDNSQLTLIDDQAFASNIGEKAFGYKVVWIVPDNFDKTKIVNNSNNVVLVTQSEYNAVVDLTPPTASWAIIQNNGIANLQVTGLQTNENTLYKLVDSSLSCSSTVKEALQVGYSVYNDSSKPQFTEQDNGKKLCLLSFDDSYNTTPQEIIVNVNLTPSVITVPADTTFTVWSVDTDLYKNVTITDTIDKPTVNDITINVNGTTVTNWVLPSTNVGTYTVTYDYTDPAGNKSITQTRTITVVPADKTGLAKAISDGTTVLTTDPEKIYEGKEPLTSTLKDAETLYNNVNATPQEITDMIKKIADGVVLVKKDTTNPVITSAVDGNTVEATITDDHSPVTTTQYIEWTQTKIPYTSNDTFTITKDLDGKVLVFEATDPYGNTTIERVPLVYKDLLPPAITIDTTTPNVATISATDSDSGVKSISYTIWSGSSIPVTWTGISLPITSNDNGKILDVKVIDNAGNMSTKQVTLIYKEQVPPVITTTTDKNTLTFTATDVDSGIDNIKYGLSLDSLTTITWTGKTIDVTKNDNGKTLYIIATDKEWNSTTKQVTLVFKDLVPPTITSTIDNNKVTFTATDDNSGVASLSYGFNTSNMKQVTGTTGIYPIIESDNGKILYVTAVDKSGNMITKEIKLVYTNGSLSGPGGDYFKNNSTVSPTTTPITTPTNTWTITNTWTTSKDNTTSPVVTNDNIREPIVDVTAITNTLLDDKCTQVVQVLNPEDLKFKDISNSDFKKYIEYLAMNKGSIETQTYEKDGVIRNTEYYNPTVGVTRAEFVKMLVRSFGCNYKAEKGITFKDVNENEWYSEYINFAVKQGWVNGYKDGTFRPNDLITRQEASKILVKATDLKIFTDVTFKDVGNTNEFKDFISTLAHNNIITKKKDIFKPLDNISRGEVSKIIANILMNR